MTHSLEGSWLSWVFIDVEGIRDYFKVILFSGIPITVVRILGGLLGFWLSGEISRALYLSVENIIAMSGGCSV